MFLAVRRSDASERAVVLPDPMEPVISSAVIGGIGDLVLAQGILDQSSLRDLSCVFVAYPGLCPGLNSLASHSGLTSSSRRRDAPFVAQGELKRQALRGSGSTEARRYVTAKKQVPHTARDKF